MSFIASAILDKSIKYPESENYFSPDEAYPEYPFQHISVKSNDVYRAIRNCLVQAGLDKENFGKSVWNPLKDIISEDSKVFVLCNFVYHRRDSETIEDFYAKCTHASVLRAVLDYILLALKKNGTVSFGNAPLQSCNWLKVLKDTGASKVLEFYQKYSDYKINAVDLRLYMAERDILGRIISSSETDDLKKVEIDLGINSLLESLYNKNVEPRFRVSDYDPRRTEAYHRKGKHIYVINKLILDSDVIVSIPKLKTHEKVGITCGLKGCVGVIGHKDCLAHHRFGPPSLSGDEYPNENYFLKWHSAFHDFVYKRRVNIVGNTFRIIDKLTRKILRMTGFNQAGNWYGNDTAWRMSLDIARIIKFANPFGKINDIEKRKHILFTDGIIGGEGEGPLSPTPVTNGFLGYCNDIVIGDYINSLLMGFDPQKIFLIKEAFSLTKYPLTEFMPSNLSMIFNNKKLSINEILIHLNKKFIPPKSWKSHIELEKKIKSPTIA